jgi:multiple sugar transport system substrate-binding protein
MKERMVNGHEQPQATVAIPESSRVSRRGFIRRAGLLSAGLAALPLLSACGGGAAPPAAKESAPAPTSVPAKPAESKPAAPAAAPAATTAPAKPAEAAKPAAVAATGAQTTVKFEGWDYEPPLVEQNIQRFESLNPTIKVDYTPIISAEYRQKLVAEFTAGVNPDALYVRDDYFAGWVTAGYLQDIEGMPGVDETYKLFYDFNADAMTYEGKRYGMPYYADVMTFVYNEELLQKAGFNAPPKTLMELEEQALKIKSAGISQFPLSLSLGLTNDFWSNWWGLIYGSGAKLFDDKLNPILDKDPAVKGVMTWINKGLNDTKIIDPASLETATIPRDNFMAGQHAFLLIARYDVEAVNNPERSKVAGKAKMALMPGLDGPGQGTVGWTRMYCLSKTTQVKDAAYKLIYYLGGLDEKKEPYTAKFWFLNRGLGFTYKALGDDPEIKAKLAKFVDPVIYSKQAENARAREAVTEPWYSEWESGNQKLMQQVFTKQLTVDDALKGMTANAEKLKKQNA